MSKKNKVALLGFLLIMVLLMFLPLFKIFIRNQELNNEINNIIYSSESENDVENIEEFENMIEKNSKQYNQNDSNNTQLDVVEDTDPWGENRPIDEEDLVLEKKIDDNSYFIVKRCLTIFYSSRENAYNVLENRVKNFDISNFYNEKKDFCIDEIYKAPIRESKDIYYIYYRVQNNQHDMENKQMMIKVDKKNVSFHIYPFEYLKSINYWNLKQDDKISLDIVDFSDIEKIEYMDYKHENLSNKEAICIKELFERFEFDVKYDLNHLYNSLDEEYKNIRFENNFQKFSSFMNNRREIYVEDIIKGYQKYELNWYTQYIIICRNDDHFVVNMVDLMNYSIQFDNYTTVIPAYSELYNSNLPHIKPKYCMDRIRKAINDENYEFIYSKLNPVQKSNYFSRFDVFVSYIQNNFYKRNVFDYKKYTKVSDSVYTYNVNVKNEMNENDYRIFKMTVTLKEAEDFSISITN